MAHRNGEAHHIPREEVELRAPLGEHAQQLVHADRRAALVQRAEHKGSAKEKRH